MRPSGVVLLMVFAGAANAVRLKMLYISILNCSDIDSRMRIDLFNAASTFFWPCWKKLFRRTEPAGKSTPGESGILSPLVRSGCEGENAVLGNCV